MASPIANKTGPFRAWSPVPRDSNRRAAPRLQLRDTYPPRRISIFQLYGPSGTVSGIIMPEWERYKPLDGHGKPLVLSFRKTGVESDGLNGLWRDFGSPVLFCNDAHLGRVLDRSKVEFDLEHLSAGSTLRYLFEAYGFDTTHRHHNLFDPVIFPLSVSWPSDLRFGDDRLAPFLFCVIGNMVQSKSVVMFGPSNAGFSANSSAELDAFFERLSERASARNIEERGVWVLRKSVEMGLKLVMYSISQGFERGFPDGMKARQERHVRNDGGTPMVASLPRGTHRSPEAHYRSAHFRMLRDERFKRDANGFPRMVWVKGSVVGKVGTAKEVS